MTTASSGSRDDYIHGVAPDEQRRLAMMNALINPPCLEELRLAPGEHVLDVGSGLGMLTREIAARVGPTGRVLGIERDDAQLKYAVTHEHDSLASNWVEFRQGDATAPPLQEDERGSFDVAHCRFLLEHVRDPAAIVRSMVESVKPGGRIVLADDDHDLLRLWPELPALDELWRRYMRAYEHIGADPTVGRKLTSLLKDAGAQPTRTNVINFGGCHGDPRFPLLVENFAGVLESARDRMDATGLASAKTINRVLADLREWAEQPDAVIWYVICIAEGRRPA